MSRDKFFEVEFYDDVVETVRDEFRVHGYRVSDECLEAIADRLTSNWEGVIANGWA
jgi:hypothetical protein